MDGGSWHVCCRPEVFLLVAIRLYSKVKSHLQMYPAKSLSLLSTVTLTRRKWEESSYPFEWKRYDDHVKEKWLGGLYNTSTNSSLCFEASHSTINIVTCVTGIQWVMQGERMWIKPECGRKIFHTTWMYTLMYLYTDSTPSYYCLYDPKTLKCRREGFLWWKRNVCPSELATFVS